MKEIPDSYRQGIQYFERLNAVEVRVWLYAMLHEKAQIFAGGYDDYPVQAIVNNYHYLQQGSQQFMLDGLNDLLADWIQSTDGSWSESAARALLDLVGALSMMSAKLILQNLVKSERFSSMTTFQPAILRAIATLSTHEDSYFWDAVKNDYPKFNRMAEQVLSRTS